MDESYDVVVIGSGFGGAVTACRAGQDRKLHAGPFCSTDAT